MAGPASNLLIATVAAILLKITLVLGGPDSIVQFEGSVRAISGGISGVLYLLGWQFLMLNTLLALFNLIPDPALGWKLADLPLLHPPQPGTVASVGDIAAIGFHRPAASVLLPPFKHALTLAYLLPLDRILTWLLQ